MTKDTNNTSREAPVRFAGMRGAGFAGVALNVVAKAFEHVFGRAVLYTVFCYP
jgi:hypothetical protein